MPALPEARSVRPLTAGSGSSSIEREAWDRHWAATGRRGGRTAFGRISSLVRKHVFEAAVRRYADRFFPAEGLFVETGCGTAESSRGLLGDGRRKLGVDASLIALRAARGAAPEFGLLAADIRRLPVRDASAAGLWNLGVLEHFPPAGGDEVLRECARVLRPGGHLIVFWPPVLGSSRLALAPVERILSIARRRRFRFFPDEVNRLRSRAHAREALQRAGLEVVAIEYPLRLLFIHAVVVGRRPPSACSP
jgi:SAM-dependent methyltransferase